MICQATPKFRLLDPYVGWEEDAQSTNNIDGLHDEIGLRIRDPHATDFCSEILTPYLPPAWIASDPQRHTIYMCGQTQFRQTDEKIGVLLRRNLCGDKWIDIRSQLDTSYGLCNPVAVACRANRLVVVDKRDYFFRVLIWSLQDGRLAGCQELGTQQGTETYVCDNVHAVAIAAWNEVLISVVCSNHSPQLLRFDLAGQPRQKLLSKPRLPFDRFVTSKDGVLWAASPTNSPEFFSLWTIWPRHIIRCTGGKEQLEFDFKRKLNVALESKQILDASLTRSPVRAASTDYLCIGELNCPESPEVECVSRTGEVLPEPPASSTVIQNISGDFESNPIDSGIPRCHWHRIRFDAELPPGASYEVELATSDNAHTKPHGISWQRIQESPTDLLIDQPPGRYLYLRIKLRGRPESPIVHRLRIDFPRVTSLDQLPVVYREDPDAEDFTERFLSLFDASIEDLDSSIEQLPAILDPDGVPEEVLPWLSNFLGIALDSDWTVDQRRALLRAAPSLYHQRGTKQGLVEAIKLLFNLDSEPVIRERAAIRRWGILNHRASLGQFRLFGKSESRFRLGSSSVGSTPLRSFGNPDHDPVQSDAYRFEVYIPPIPGRQTDLLNKIDQLIGSQKPAHTQHSVRIGGEGFIIGHRSIIGIDTQLVAPPPAVLSDGQSRGLRLGDGVLRPGPNRPTSSLHLNMTFTVGVNTSLE